MKFDTEAAKKAGYTDYEIQSFLNKNPEPKKFDIEGAKKAGYTDQEIKKFLGKDDSGSIGRNAMQSVIGGAKGAIYASPAGAPAAIAEASYPAAIQNVISELMESDIEHQYLYPGEFPPLNRQQIEQGAKATEKQILGENGLVEGAVTAPYRAAGIETEPQSPSEKSVKGVSELLTLFQTGKLTPETFKKAFGGALIGEATKEALEEAGVPSWLSFLFGVGTGSKIPNIKPSVKVEKKLPSGLTEPKALEAESAYKGRITKAQESKAIGVLEEEASALFKKKAEEHIPLKKQIEEGKNFHKDYDRRFEDLRSVAKKANPEIDTTPLNKYLSKSTEEFRGVRRLDKEASQIKKEATSFLRNPADDLSSLLNTFRSTNRKLRSKYERAKLHGSQETLVKFLEGMNKKITESIEKTLPENSAWLKEFKDLNKYYSNYKNSVKALDQLEPVLGDKISPSAVRRLATNIKDQKKLALSVGKQEASEIVQIAKDLDKAVQAVKKIPKKEWAKWEKYLPFSILIPGHGTAISVGAGVVKAHDLSKRLYGTILLSPAKRKLYSEALEAIETQNLNKYLSATQKLAHSLEEPED